MAPGLHGHLVAQPSAPSTCLDLSSVMDLGSGCLCASPGLGRDKCHPGPLCKESCLSRYQHLGCDNWAGPPARATPSRAAPQADSLALQSLRILGTVEVAGTQTEISPSLRGARPNGLARDPVCPAVNPHFALEKKSTGQGVSEGLQRKPC